MAAERRAGTSLKKRITYAVLTILLIWSLLSFELLQRHFIDQPVEISGGRRCP